MSSSMNIVSLFLDQVQAQPNALVLKVPQRSFGGRLSYQTRTFQALNQEIDATARYLLDQGIAPKHRVLLMVKPGLEFLQLVFALFKIGAVPILLDPGLGLRSYLKSIQHSQVDALIGIAKGLVLSFVCCRYFPKLKKRILIHRGFQSKIRPYLSSATFELYPTQGTDLAAILFTSGSTGAPKGVCYQHRHFMAQVAAIQKAYAIKPGTVDLPLLAIFTLFNPVLGCLSVLPELDASQPAKLNPKKIIQAILENKVQSSFGSPTLWDKIGDYCLDKKIDLPCMERILIAGASLSPQLLKKLKNILPGGEVYTPYGATEGLPISNISGKTLLEKEPPRHVFAGTCLGQPVDGVRVKIIKLEEGPIEGMKGAKVLRPGDIGEIIVQGPMVTDSYDQLPQATLLAKIRDGQTFWHRMGDLGYLDTEGYLWFCGRKVELVQTQEGPLYTEPCERIFRDDPRVQRVALISLGKNKGGAALVIEPRDGFFPKNKEERLLFKQDILRIAQKFPASQAISAIFFENKMPLDIRHNAKIHRLRLRDKYSIE